MWIVLIVLFIINFVFGWCLLVSLETTFGAHKKSTINSLEWWLKCERSMCIFVFVYIFIYMLSLVGFVNFCRQHTLRCWTIRTIIFQLIELRFDWFCYVRYMLSVWINICIYCKVSYYNILFVLCRLYTLNIILWFMFRWVCSFLKVYTAYDIYVYIWFV